MRPEDRSRWSRAAGPGSRSIASEAYTGTTTVTGGTLTISGGGSNGTISAATAITGTSSGTFEINRNDNVSFNNTITGSVNFSKANNNVLTMPGTYGYSGVTAINSGTLLVTGVLPSAGTVNVNDGATLAGTGNGTTGGVVGNVFMNGNSHVTPGASSNDGSIGTLTMAGLIDNSGELRFDLGASSNDRINVTGSAIFSGGSISVAGTPNPGTYTILTAGALTLNVTPTVVQPSDSNERPATYTLNTATANTLKLVITGGPVSLTWVGALNANAWDIHTTQNWTSGSPDFFYNQDSVNFTNSGARTVNISNGDVSPGNVTFSHSTGSYTINGNNGITGSGNLSITGGGTVVMNTNNSYTGTTAIQNGTLILGNSNAIPGNGTSSLVLGNNTTSGVLDTGGFDVDVSGLSTSGTGAGNIIGNSSTSSPSHINFNGGSSTFAGIIQDSINGGTQQVNLNVNSGTLVLASNNTYSGNTEVQGSAELQIGTGGNTGSFGSGNLNVDGTIVFDRSDKLTITQNVGGSGTFIINSGTVQIGDGNADGQLGSGTIVINGALAYDRSDNISPGNPLAGTGTLYQNGTGVLFLGNSTSFAGGITINSGSARVTVAGAAGNGATVTLNGGTFVAAATLGTDPIVFAGGTLGSAANPTVLTSGPLFVTAGTTSTIYAGDVQNGTDSNGTFTGAVHGSGTLLTAAIGTGTTTDGGPGIRFSGTGSDFNGTVVIGPNVKGEVATATATGSPLGTGSIIMTGGTVTGALAGTYSELNLRNNGTGNTVFGNNLSIAGTGVVVVNPLNTTNPMTSTLGVLTIGTGQTMAIDKNTASGGGANTLDVAAFQSVNLIGNATFQPTTNGGGWSGTASLVAGPISESVPGSNITMNGLGTFTMTGTNTYAGGTNVQSGTLISNVNYSNGPLSITGGFAQVGPKASSGDPTGASIVPSLTITGATSALDLTNNALVIDYTPGNSPFTTVQGQIITGYAGGLWNGPGINSSSAAAAFT